MQTRGALLQRLEEAEGNLKQAQMASKSKVYYEAYVECLRWVLGVR